jgi:thiosulfate reductase cytochrome b subunit
MADAASVRRIVTAVDESATARRHSAVVRVTHWIITLCFFALLVSGVEILISHPRFYWGETGNVLTPPLFSLPIPASRSYVPTGYGFVLPDQNGWSRDLHFQGAWIVVFTALVYGCFGVMTRHFRRNLLPTGLQLTPSSLLSEVGNHVRFKRPKAAEAWSYNALQRLAYLSVIFVVFPLTIWTGLAMSPAVAAAFPMTVSMFGGHQSARTLHFFCSVFLVLFLLVHVGMVWRAGWSQRMRAMITGRADASREQS